MDQQEVSNTKIRETARYILDIIQDSELNIYDSLETLKVVREALQPEANDELKARHYG